MAYLQVGHGEHAEGSEPHGEISWPSRCRNARVARLIGMDADATEGSELCHPKRGRQWIKARRLAVGERPQLDMETAGRKEILRSNR